MASLDLTAKLNEGSLRISGAIQRAHRWLVSRIIEVSPRTLAIFRIYIGLSIYYFISSWYTPGSYGSVYDNGAYYYLNSFQIIHWLSASESFGAAAFNVLCISSLTFAVGIFSRASFLILVISLWVFALLCNIGHFITPLLLGLTCSLPARWGDALSLDALLFARRRTGNKAPSVIYGYPIYVCGLAIALAYAAAGLSKIVITDGAWLWDTGARWGFVQDLFLAPTDLGFWFINDYLLAVAGSVFVCVGQISYLAACFTRQYRIKLLICIFVAVPFLIGLIVFMGLFWWPWVILVVALYAPWQWLDRKLTQATPTAGPGQMDERKGHRRWAVGAILVLLGLHTYVVAAKVEHEPLISNYPMYAVPMPPDLEGDREVLVRLAGFGRDHRFTIEVLGADRASEDLTSVMRWAHFLGRARIALLDETLLDPSKIWEAASAGGPMPRSLCQDLIAYRDRKGEQAPISGLRFGLERYFFDDTGRLSWRMDERAVEVDLTSSDCGYRWLPLRRADAS